MITLTETEWIPIRKRLKEEYSWKPSIMLIREVMRRELGFTIREKPPNMICLDFFDDVKETHFRLKYL